MGTDHGASSEPRLPLHQEDCLTITDAIPIDITVIAADGTVLYVNQFALNRLGLNAEAVKNKGYLKQTCSRSGEYRWHLAQYNPLIEDSGRRIIPKARAFSIGRS